MRTPSTTDHIFKVRLGNNTGSARLVLWFFLLFPAWSPTLFSSVPSKETGAPSKETGAPSQKTLAPSDAQTLIAAGDALQATGRWREARAELEKALALPGCTVGERHRAQVKIAAGFLEEADDSQATSLLESLLSDKELGTENRAAALLLTAKVFSKYGDRTSWEKVRKACLEALSLEDADPASRMAAREAIVPAYLYFTQNREARRELEALTSLGGQPGQTLLSQLVALARVLILEKAYIESRSALDRASSLLDEAAGDGANNNENRAEIQLLRGLSFMEEGLEGRAKAELQQVAGMAGQSAASPQTREALVRLSLRKWLPEEEPTLRVLFIGSSHTIRGNLPLLIEQMAASAPAGSLRIRAGEHVRTGTGMRVFWEEGEAKHTARGKIAGEAWDAVVVETFYRNPRQMLEEYAGKYAGLARENGARLIVYESPVAKETPYPDGFAAFHEENVRLGRLLDLPVAPSVHAWMQILGGKPTPQKMGTLYADWIHASLKGAYLTACCVYSALTNRSPAGLAYPEGVSSEEAMLFQKIAWNSFEETEAAKKR